MNSNPSKSYGHVARSKMWSILLNLILLSIVIMENVKHKLKRNIKVSLHNYMILHFYNNTEISFHSTFVILICENFISNLVEYRIFQFLCEKRKKWQITFYETKEADPRPNDLIKKMNFLSPSPFYKSQIALRSKNTDDATKLVWSFSTNFGPRANRFFHTGAVLDAKSYAGTRLNAKCIEISLL